MHGTESDRWDSLFQTEEEVTLLICSGNPSSVLEELAELTVLGDFRIYPADSLNLHDRYFDTPDKSIRDRHAALRVRQIESKSWLTFKGPSQTREDGFGSRMEFEAEWSERTLSKVLELLARSGIELPHRHTGASARSHPIQALIDLGLVVVQDRETFRIVREIVPQAVNGTLATAMLLIDSVVYRFEEKKIRHYEVEIEAMIPDGAGVLKSLTQSLTDRFGRTLLPWNHSKLATGWALESLRHDLDVAGLIKEGRLLPAAYEQIDGFLR